MSGSPLSSTTRPSKVLDDDALLLCAAIVRQHKTASADKNSFLHIQKSLVLFKFVKVRLFDKKSKLLRAQAHKKGDDLAAIPFGFIKITLRSYFSAYLFSDVSADWPLAFSANLFSI